MKFESVRLAGGNHYEGVIETYLREGWSIKKIIECDYEKGHKHMYITFETEHGQSPVMDYPNAYKI